MGVPVYGTLDLGGLPLLPPLGTPIGPLRGPLGSNVTSVPGGAIRIGGSLLPGGFLSISGSINIFETRRVPFVGINGFGRIGRLILRASLDKVPQVVCINDPFLTPEQMAYLLQFDSSHGHFSGEVEACEDAILVNGARVAVFREKDPKRIPWADNGALTVVESTGIFTESAQAQWHFNGGAKSVIISSPSKDAPTFIMGVNHQSYLPHLPVISTSSCSANCLAPIAHIVHENFGILESTATVIHSLTATQKTVDAPSRKAWRDGRSGNWNIIPASTTAAKSVMKVIPSLCGKVTATAFRVPVANVSVIDFTCKLNNETKLDNIKTTMREAAEGAYAGILGYTEDDVVSTDFNTSTYSSIFDAKAGIALNKSFVKLVSWFDNEHGYAHRVVDMIHHIHSIC